MIAHRDWVQEPGTVLSGATWMTSLPLANLQNYKLSKVARSDSPNQLAPYILVDFGAALRPPVTGIVIPRHNLYQTARWRIRMGADPSFSLATLAYDTRPSSGTTTSLSSIIVAAPQTVTLVVTDALTFFPGVAVVISHARLFLDRIATHILAFEGDSRVEWFAGNYQDYEEDRHRRLGAEADQPHRLKYRPLRRGE